MSHGEYPDFRRPLPPPDLRVRLSMFLPSQGGRDKPLWQGCRIPNDFGIPGRMNDGLYEFFPAPPAPGDTAECHVWLFDPECNAGRLFPGFEYRAWSDGKFVAQGVVLEVLNETLRRT